MRTHPRLHLVQTAERKLDQLVWDWMSEHDVTYTEAMSCLIQVSQRINMYQLRMERHPDNPDRKAGEA